MRKTASALVLALLLVGAFLAGARYGMRPSVGTGDDAGPTARPVLYYAGDPAPGGASAPTSAGAVFISPDKQQLIGVRLGDVEKHAWTHSLRVLGRVVVDETRIYRINAATDGWIRETFANSTGSLVMKDETLAAFYGPEFLAAEQAYLYALGALERFSASGGIASPEQIALTRANIQRAKDSLIALGMGAAQVEEIGRTGQYSEKILLSAPATSFVVVRNVSPGQRFDRGTELYRLADLSRVWILADLFEGETAYFRPGVRARVSLPQQGKVLDAHVSHVLPQFDAATRALKLRLEAENPGFVLRPDMFVDVNLPVTFPDTIAVPVDAVLDSGLERTVFVQRGPGLFEPRRVETGWRFGDRVQIVRGLARGERIVTSGTFLIDSESRMNREHAAVGEGGALHHHHDYHVAPATPAHDVARPAPVHTITAHDGQGAHPHD